MAMLNHLTMAALNFAIAVIDIAAIFLLARLVASQWPNRWVQALDRVGRPFTDPISDLTVRQASKVTGRRLRPEVVPVLALLALLALRLVIELFAAGL